MEQASAYVVDVETPSDEEEWKESDNTLTPHQRAKFLEEFPEILRRRTSLVYYYKQWMAM